MKNNFIRLLNSRRGEYIIISIIIILGFIVRLYKINTPLASWHSFRQADTPSVTRFFINSTYTIFLIGRELMNKWGGLISASLFAFLPFNIYFTRVILPEPMVVC